MPTTASQRKCPNCGFWLETLNESQVPWRGAKMAALASIPIMGDLIVAFMLFEDNRQRREGPFWCWRCKAEVAGNAESADSPKRTIGQKD
jgi:hypothetical protein